MITIVMAYNDRPFQLKKTLLSIKGVDNVVIVDDDSILTPDIPDVDFNVEVITLKKGNWKNGIPAYNIGFQRAIDLGSDIVIIQNPECYHVGNVVDIAKNIEVGQYIVFGCFSIDKETTFNDHNINEVLNEKTAIANGDVAWYNHSIFRPVNYHFCSAIRVDDLIKINGFDERLSFGFAYDDNMLLHQIKSLGLEIKSVDNPFVVHQWHYQNELPKIAEMYAHNQALFEQFSLEPVISGVHLITGDLHK